DREDISPAVDPEAAISGPEEEEDPEDISPAGSPEAAVSGLGDKDSWGIMKIKTHLKKTQGSRGGLILNALWSSAFLGVPLTLPLKVERTLRVRSTVRGERTTEVVLLGAGENQGVLTDCEKKSPRSSCCYRGGGWWTGPSVSSPLSEEGSEELKEMLDSIKYPNCPFHLWLLWRMDVSGGESNTRCGQMWRESESEKTDRGCLRGSVTHGTSGLPFRRFDWSEGKGRRAFLPTNQIVGREGRRAFLDMSLTQRTAGSGNEQQESVKVLAVSFKNGKEIKRKIYSVQSTNHLLEPTQEPVLLNGLTDLLKKKIPEVFDELQTNGILTEKTRLKLLKVCISDLVERHGFYPSNTEKVVLAKNLITIFPQLKVQVGGYGEGFEHLYDPASHSGFLEMRLRNIRRKLEEVQRRYRRHKRSRDVGPSSVQDEGDIKECINLMKKLRPSAENISSIKSAMQKTFTSRRSWISKHSPTINQIFQEYPRFLDIPTLFEKIFDGQRDPFIRLWEASIMPKLKAVAAKGKGDVTALIEGMENQTDGSSIDSLFDAPQDPGQTIQPHLVCIGHHRRGSQQYVIVAKSDKIAIPLDEGLGCAVDKLFKLYWVCNLAYPTPLSSVFSFFEHIYDLPMSANRRAKVLDLISKLKSVN
ncbi:hypothetical protein NQZ68_035361, partial [Dissostichus eleginoides]